MGPSEKPILLIVSEVELGRSLAEDFRYPFLRDRSHVEPLVAQGFSCVTVVENIEHHGHEELACIVIVLPDHHDRGTAHQHIYGTPGLDPLKLNADVGTFAWVTNEKGQVLLVHQAYGRKLWGLPGGELYIFESPSAAVEREVKEETGYDVTALDLLAVYGRRQHLGFYFGCSLVGGNPRETWDSEIAGIGWFDPADLPQPRNPAIDLFQSDMASGKTQARFF